MNFSPSTLQMAANCAGVACERLGWPTGASAISPKAFNGLRRLVLEMFEQADAKGMLAPVYGNLLNHLSQDDTARVRETVTMLISGYVDGVIECCK